MGVSLESRLTYRPEPAKTSVATVHPSDGDVLVSDLSHFWLKSDLHLSNVEFDRWEYHSQARSHKLGRVHRYLIWLNAYAATPPELRSWRMKYFESFISLMLEDVYTREESAWVDVHGLERGANISRYRHVGLKLKSCATFAFL